MAVVARAGF